MLTKTISRRAGRIAVATGLLAAVGVTVGGVATANQASAAGCYESMKFFAKDDGTYYAPGTSTWFRTTSNCRDIQVKSAAWLDTGAYMKVCFKKTGCQGSWTWVPAGGTGWRVIATDVKDGTDYNLRFLNGREFQGFRAD